jgi:peptidylprolyl isomerase
VGLAVVALLVAGCARPLPRPAPPPVAGEERTQFMMRYVEVQPGTGAAAEPGKCFYVHYTGWLTDGTKFDSSRDTTREGKPRTPLAFEQGRRTVISGWDAGFEGMRVGGKRRLIIPYQLAYGEKGRPPVIPPKATLVFDVELMDVRDAPAATRPPEPPARCPSWEARAAVAPQGNAALPGVRLATTLGDIELEIDTAHAPITGRAETATSSFFIWR